MLKHVKCKTKLDLVRMINRLSAKSRSMSSQNVDGESESKPRKKSASTESAQIMPLVDGLSPICPKAVIRYTGSKYNWHRELDDLQDFFNSYDTIIDAFGGSGWVTHYLSRMTNKPTLILNDFDHVVPLITNPDMMSEYNECLSQVIQCFKKGAIRDGIDPNSLTKFSYTLGNNAKGECRHKDLFEMADALCRTFPNPAAATSLRQTFAYCGTISPNVMYYDDVKPRKCVPDYIGRAKVISCSAFDIEITPEMGKTLVICDPPYGTIGEDRWYNLGDNECDKNKSSNPKTYNDKIIEKFSPFDNVDLMLFGIMGDLASLPDPSRIVYRNRSTWSGGGKKSNITAQQCAVIYTKG